MAIFMQKRSAAASSGGFTLVELTVVIAIFAAVAALVLVNESRFDATLFTTSLAYDTGILIRQAQSYGISVKQVSFSDFTHATYGVHFDAAVPKGFLLFADLDNSLSYNTGGNTATGCVSGTECLSFYQIKKGNFIDHFCGITAAGSMDCSNGGAIDALDIMFERPHPESIIVGYKNGIANSSKYTAASITVSSPSGIKRVVCVYYIGQIAVKFPPADGVSNVCI